MYTDKPLQSPVGVIATHGEFPIERMKLDRNGKFLGSVSHDDCLKLTDVSELFEDSDGEEDVKSDASAETAGVQAPLDEDDDVKEEEDDTENTASEPEVDADGDTAMDSSDDEDSKATRREKRKAKQKEKKEGSKKQLLQPKEDKDGADDGRGFFADL